MADERMELNELQREWRREVSDSLKDHRTRIDQLTTADQVIRETYASGKSLEELDQRVTTLERDKAKIIGGALILNFVGGIVLWFLSK